MSTFFFKLFTLSFPHIFHSNKEHPFPIHHKQFCTFPSLTEGSTLAFIILEAEKNINQKSYELPTCPKPLRKNDLSSMRK